jgi:hypothetical protein
MEIPIVSKEGLKLAATAVSVTKNKNNKNIGKPITNFLEFRIYHPNS